MRNRKNQRTILPTGAKGIPHGSVSSQLDRSVGSFSSPRPYNAFPKGCHALVGECASNDHSQAIAGHLHSGLDRFDGMSEIHRKNTRHSTQSDGLQQGWCGFLDHFQASPSKFSQMITDRPKNMTAVSSDLLHSLMLFCV